MQQVSVSSVKVAFQIGPDTGFVCMALLCVLCNSLRSHPMSALFVFTWKLQPDCVTSNAGGCNGTTSRYNTLVDPDWMHVQATARF